MNNKEYLESLIEIAKLINADLLRIKIALQEAIDSMNNSKD